LGEVDVAFRLMPAHWGLGLATEAAIASVRYGFDKLRLKSAAGRIRRVRTIIGLVMPQNIASVRVLEKTGLRYLETISFWDYEFSKYVIEAGS
jgi:ribosomal-protein-alanine N-acetyltransferase